MNIDDARNSPGYETLESYVITISDGNVLQNLNM